MNRKLNPRVVAGTVAGLAVAGGGAAVAATHSTSPKQESQAVVEDAAHQLGIQPSKLSNALESALENRVDAAVAAGQITKTQGDALKKRIATGDVPFFAGPALRGHGFGFHHGGPGLDAAAAYLGLTDAQLDTQLRAGKTLADVAKTKNKSSSGLVDAMVADLEQHLDAAVKAGDLTQAQERSMLENASSRITDLVNGKAPAFGRDSDGEHGFGFRGGPPPGAPSGDPGI